MIKKNTIFWDDDTQYDFMRPEGRLYVPDAESIIYKISKIRRFALENGFSIIASTDWHSLEDEEISNQPDYKQTYPPHCIANQKGAERVGYLGNIEIGYIDNSRMSQEQLHKLVESEQFHIVIRKNDVDVFTNPNTEPLLDLIKPETVIIFGVALDVCVSISAHDLLKYGKAELIILADAVKGLGQKPDSEILAELQQKGVKISSFSKLNNILKVYQQA